MGTVFGPHPFPSMVRDFQSIIGKEAKKQILQAEGRLPDYLIACVGGGSNAMGLFHEFLGDDIKMIGVEAGGKGIETGEHAARFAGGSVGVFQGCKPTFFRMMTEIFSERIQSRQDSIMRSRSRASFSQR